jgi:hypothetical protein
MTYQLTLGILKNVFKGGIPTDDYEEECVLYFQFDDLDNLFSFIKTLENSPLDTHLNQFAYKIESF